MSFNVSSSPLETAVMGGAHPSILPDSRLLHQEAPVLCLTEALARDPAPGVTR